MANDFKEIEAGLRNSFKRVKDELEDHLHAINENTEEIQCIYEFLGEIENKLDKLNEKIEQVQLVLGKLEVPVDAALKIKPLTINERQVFLAIYAAESPISYEDLAKQLNYSSTLTKTYVQNLIDKKIPVIISFVDGNPHLSLEKSFKELQAKENIVGLDQKSLKERY